MSGKLGRLVLLFLGAAAFLCVAPAIRAEGNGENGEEPTISNDGPVFLMISLDGSFDTSLNGWSYDGTWEFDGTCEWEYDCTPQGSLTLIIPVGIFQAGAAIGNARFLPDVMEPDPMEENGLDGHQYTIIGSFDTTGPNTVHLVTPVPGTVPPEVEVAYHNASQHPDFDLLFPESTTVEIAQFIFDNQGGAGATFEDILNYLFTPEETTPPEGEEPPPPNPEMECDSPCMAEGDLFAHSTSGDPLFRYDFTYDPELGTLALDLCLIVEVEVNQKSVNLKKKGTIPITIHASDTFDTDDIDEDTIEIGGVFPNKVNFAKNKAVCHFSVPALVDAGVLDENTTEVTLHAFLLDDMGCIEGTAPINIK